MSCLAERVGVVGQALEKVFGQVPAVRVEGMGGPYQAGRVDASLNSVLVAPPSLSNIFGTASAVL